MIGAGKEGLPLILNSPSAVAQNTPLGVIRAYLSQDKAPAIETRNPVVEASTAVSDGGGARRSQVAEPHTAAVSPPNVRATVVFGAPGTAPTWCSSDKDYVTAGRLSCWKIRSAQIILASTNQRVGSLNLSGRAD